MTDYPEFEQYRETLAERFADALRRGKHPLQLHAGSKPYNPITGKRYRGMAAIALALEGYTDPRWITRDEAQTEDWTLRPGELGTLVEQLRTDHTIVLSMVYNVEQFDMVPPLSRPAIYSIAHRSHKAHVLLRSTGAVLSHSLMTASSYCPLRDEIRMGLRVEYETNDDYYGAALLQLAHWTGHSSRMARAFGAAGDADNRRESFTADIAAWMLAEEIGTAQTIASTEKLTDWFTELSEQPELLSTLVRTAEDIVAALLQAELGGERDQALEFANQALDAQVLVERIAEAREPIPELIADAKLYTANNRDAHDSLSRIIRRAAIGEEEWSSIRIDAQRLLVEQREERRIEELRLEVVRQKSMEPGCDADLQRTPNFEHKAGLHDPVIIRGNSGKDSQQTQRNAVLVATVELPSTSAADTSAVTSQTLGAASRGPAGSSNYLNDIVLPLPQGAKDSRTEEPLEREQEPIHIKQRKTLARLSFSLER